MPPRLIDGRKPEVLLVSRKWPPAVGGMETYSAELARSLQTHFQVSMLVLPGKPNGDPPGLMRYAVFVVRAMGHLLIYGRRYSNVVFTDLLLFPAAAMHRMVAPRHRRVVVIHGLDLVFHKRAGWLSRSYGAFLAAFRASQGMFASIVANSRNTAALAHDVGLRHVTVINPCLPQRDDTSAGCATTEWPAAWLHAHKRVLYFGRLVPRKGSVWFAENVLPSLPAGAEFFVVGHAPDPVYRARLAKCERTHCLGRVDDASLAALIAAADVVVMPNIATPESVDVEGFGIAAIEASSQGAILLASAIDGVTDAVIDGVTGTLVPPGDTARWIEATREAIAEPAVRRDARRNTAALATRDRYSSAEQAQAFSRLLDASNA